jgi:hypothetical protein
MLRQGAQDWVHQEHRQRLLVTVCPEVLLHRVRRRQPEFVPESGSELRELQAKVQRLRWSEDRLPRGQRSSVDRESARFAASLEFPYPAICSAPLPVPLSLALPLSRAHLAIARAGRAEEQEDLPVLHRAQVRHRVPEQRE